MNIYYDSEWSTILVYYDKENSKKVDINKKIFENNSFDNNLSWKTYFLLSEKYFSYYSCDVSIYVENKFSKSELNTIIKRKLDEYLSNEWKWLHHLFNYVDNIFVNWENQEYVLLKSWYIYFRINYVFLNNEKIRDFRRTKHIELSNLFPRSMFTINYIKNIVKRYDFYMIYIEENIIKLIDVENWFYKNIEIFNYWLKNLKKTFIEDSTIAAYNDIMNSKNINNINVAIFKAKVDFFYENIAKRLDNKLITRKWMFVFSPFLKSEIFLNCFFEKFSKTKVNFFLPFIKSKYLDDFWKKRISDNIDILTFTNNVKFLQKS